MEDLVYMGEVILTNPITKKNVNFNLYSRFARFEVKCYLIPAQESISYYELYEVSNSVIAAIL